MQAPLPRPLVLEGGSNLAACGAPILPPWLPSYHHGFPPTAAALPCQAVAAAFRAAGRLARRWRVLMPGGGAAVGACRAAGRHAGQRGGSGGRVAGGACRAAGRACQAVAGRHAGRRGGSGGLPCGGVAVGACRAAGRHAGAAVRRPPHPNPHQARTRQLITTARFNSTRSRTDRRDLLPASSHTSFLSLIMVRRHNGRAAPGALA
jgi:hypothetical protein